MQKAILGLAAALLIPTAALAHGGHGETSSLFAGLQHPLSGLDHITAMIAVGLLAALKRGRVLWLWPLTFVGVMLIGGVLGMAQVQLPFTEPAILASVVVLGLLLALAIDLPVAVGAAIVGVFALFHGHAHGAEAAGVGGLGYMIGFALTTAALHCAGIAPVLGLQTARLQPLVRLAGVACALIGMALAVQAM